MDCLISAESNPYQTWQLQLLEHTFREVRQPGSLVCLLAGSESLPLGSATVILRPSVTRHPTTGDFYPPYNKPASLCDYFSSLPPGDRTYLLLDPDMVFVRPWSPRVSSDLAIGEETLYMDPTRPPGPTVVRRHCRCNPGLVRPVGFPIVIHEQLLRSLVDRWHLLTEEMREDRVTRSLVGWVAEMFAFTIAAAEAGVRFRAERNCSFLHDPEGDRPLIHYTYNLNTPLGFRWDKRDHVPGTPLPPLRDDVPAAGRAFHRIMDGYLSRTGAVIPRDPT